MQTTVVFDLRLDSKNIRREFGLHAYPTCADRQVSSAFFLRYSGVRRGHSNIDLHADDRLTQAKSLQIQCV